MAQVISWEDPMPVASEEWDNNRPRLTLNSEGAPVVMWGDNSSNQLYVSVWNGTGFSDPITPIPDLECFTADWAGPELSGNEDHLIVTFKRMPENSEGIYLTQSFDGGSSWSEPLLLEIDETVDQTRFPDVSVDNNGDIALSFMTFEGNYIDPGYEFKKSIDQGVSWSPIQNTSTAFIEGEACDCCTADIVQDGERVIQLWRNDIDNIREVYAVLSSDGGSSFDQILQIDHSDTYSNVCFSSGPNGIVEGDNLVSVFRKNVGTDRRIGVVVTDLLTGENSLEETVGGIDQGNVNYNNAKVAHDGVFTAIVYEKGAGNGSEVVCSAADGNYSNLVSYQDTVNVNLTGRQTNPDVALNGNLVHVVWQDADTDQVWYRSGTISGNSVEEKEQSAFIVYPNPSSGMVHFISSKRITHLNVYNQFGEICSSTALNAVTYGDIDLTVLNRGVYIVEITTQDASQRRTIFVKE